LTNTRVTDKVVSCYVDSLWCLTYTRVTDKVVSCYVDSLWLFRVM
jgi:hypothetical protein